MNENEIIEQLRQGDARLFDRLADRELTTREQHILLAALDDEPGGWRRLRLALLESQAWRGDLASFGESPREPVTPRVANTRRAWPIGTRLAAIAAALLAAFIVGWSLGDRGTEGLAESDSTRLAAAAGENSAAQPGTPEDNTSNPELSAAQALDVSMAQWETVRIRGGDGQEFDLPVVDAATGYDEWLEQQRIGAVVPDRQDAGRGR